MPSKAHVVQLHDTFKYCIFTESQKNCLYMFLSYLSKSACLHFPHTECLPFHKSAHNAAMLLLLVAGY